MGLLYGPGYLVDSSTLADLERTLDALIDRLLAGESTPEAGSVTDAKVAENAEIAQSKIAGLQAALAAKASVAALAAEINAREAADLLLVPLTQLGAADGVATIGPDGKIPSSQLPAYRLDQLAVPTSPVNLNGQRLTNGALPVADSDVITKAYADALRAGMLLKADPARVMVATNVNINAPGAALDSIALTVGDRVLLTGQASANDNGIYTWQGPAAPMVRAADANTSAEMRSGTAVWVTEGTSAEQRWVLITPDPITLGVTAQTWGYDGGVITFNAGAGMTKTGTTLDVVAGTGIVVGPDTVSVDPAVMADIAELGDSPGVGVSLRQYGGIPDAIQVNGVKMVAAGNILEAPAGAAFTSRVSAGMKVIVGSAGNADQITGLRSSVAAVIDDTHLQLANVAVANTLPGPLDAGGYNVTASIGTDNGPALQAALNALGPRGGTVVVDEGLYLIWTPVSKTNPSPNTGGPDIAIRGEAGGSGLIIATSTATQVALNLAGFNHVTLADLTVLGTPFCKTDAACAVRVAGARIFDVLNVEWKGVSTHATNRGVVEVDTSTLRMRGQRFGGCGGNEITRSSVIRCTNWAGIDIEGVHLIDFAIVNGTNYAKSGLLAKCWAWLHVLDPASEMSQGPPATAGSYGQSTVKLRGVNLDEGVVYGVLVEAPTKRVSNVHLDDVYVNVGYYSELPGTTAPQGVRIQNVEAVEIDRSFFGYRLSNPAVAAVALADVGVAEVRKSTFAQNGNIIAADSACGTLRVIDCVGYDLQSDATKTYDEPAGVTVAAVSTQTLAADGAVTIDAAEGDVHVITLAADATSSAILNGVEGQVLTLVLVQDEMGGRSWEWPDDVVFLRPADAGGGGGGDHPDLSVHDALGLATQAELEALAATAATADALAAQRANNLSDLASAATARTNLGLGSMATQGAGAVSITGGTVAGIADLAVADGGTGASSAGAARTNLGLGTMATQDATAVAITGGAVTGITDLTVADGGTGASSAAAARTNLGVYSTGEVDTALAPYGKVQRDEYTTPGTFTWTKPAWAKTIRVIAIAGGGGGGSGRRGAAASVRCGGGGGGGGAWSAHEFAAADVASSMEVIVGAGGAGGAAVTANDTNGNAGAAGGNSVWEVPGYLGTTAQPVLRARGGGGGGGGTAAAGAAGAAPTFGMFNGSAGAAASGSGAAGVAGATANFAAGGGSGAGVTSADAVAAGGTGGASDVIQRNGGAAGAAGANGTNGLSPLTSVSVGGGGGGSSITGVGGNGGNGGSAAGGGGGGGASLNGNNSGAGGNGGNGAVVLVSVG